MASYVSSVCIVSAASKNWAGEPADSVEESRLSVRRGR